MTETDPSLTQQDQLLLAWLFSAISPSVLPQITACKTSFDVWSALAAIFNTKSKTRVLQLRNQLQNFQKNDLTDDDYVAQLTTMAEELREAGIAITDGELSLIALNGLDVSYDSFVTAQTARMEDISFASFLGLLRAYELRLNRSIESKGIAMENSVQATSSDTTVVNCQICLKNGHSAIQCFNRHNEQRFPTQHSKGRNRYKGVRSNNSHANAVWYPDTGASDHVIGEARNIQNSDTEPVARPVTVVKGKSLPISKFGRSNVYLGPRSVKLDNILYNSEFKKNLLSVNRLCIDNDVSLQFDD